MLHKNVFFAFSTGTYRLFTVSYQYCLQSLLPRQSVSACILDTQEIFWTRCYSYCPNIPFHSTITLSCQIPDFAGFWILSVFIQTPLQIYLMTSEQILKYNTSTVLQAIQCLLLVLQIASSFTAIRRASRFRRQQFQAEKASYDLDHHRTRRTMGSNISIISD